MVLSETVARIFLERVFSTPDWIVWEDYEGGLSKSYTFRSLYDRSELIARSLRKYCLRDREKIVLCLPSSWEALVFGMAALGACLVEVVLDPRLPVSVLVTLLEEVEGRVLVVEGAGFLKKLGEDPRFSKVLASLEKVIVLDDLSEDFVSLNQVPFFREQRDSKFSSEFEDRLSSWSPADIMSMVYTQGISGMPRPVFWTHAQVVQAMEHASRDFGSRIAAQSCVVSCLPTTHAFGKLVLLTSWALGWKYCFRTSWSLQLLEEKELFPSIFFGSTRFFEDWYGELQKKRMGSGKKALYDWAYGVAKKCTRSSWELLPWKDALEYRLVQRFLLQRLVYPWGKHLKMVVCLGGSLPASVQVFFAWHGIAIWEGYGLTETCGWIALREPGKVGFKSWGRLKVDAEGEIWVGTFQGWLATGDLGSISAHGFQFLGRKQDQLWVEGRSVSVVRWETLARFSDWIRQLVLYAHPEFGLVALVTLKSEEVVRYAQDHQILFSAYDRLINHPRILSCVQKSIDTLNESFEPHEKLRRFVILAEALSISRGELSVLGDFFRKKIAETYDLQLKSMDEDEKAE
jgi:long-chain acyl-CoA synthetase